jgi:hypothetical protein
MSDARGRSWMFWWKTLIMIHLLPWKQCKLADSMRINCVRLRIANENSDSSWAIRRFLLKPNADLNSSFSQGLLSGKGYFKFELV